MGQVEGGSLVRKSLAEELKEGSSKEEQEKC